MQHAAARANYALRFVVQVRNGTPTVKNRRQLCNNNLAARVAPL